MLTPASFLFLKSKYTSCINECFHPDGSVRHTCDSGGALAAERVEFIDTRSTISAGLTQAFVHFSFTVISLEYTQRRITTLVEFFCKYTSWHEEKKVKYRRSRAHKSICSHLEHLHTRWGSRRASPRIHRCLSHKTAPLTLQRAKRKGGICPTVVNTKSKPNVRIFPLRKWGVITRFLIKRETLASVTREMAKFTFHPDK